MQKSMSFEDWKKFNGFSKDNSTYMVIGDSYSIKDTLKENGFKFSPMLLWHSPVADLRLPEGLNYVRFLFSEIFSWQGDISKGIATILCNAQELINQRTLLYQEPSKSEYVGNIGDRLRKIPAIYLGSSSFCGTYGDTNIHKFQINDNILVWFTNCHIRLKPKTEILLSGTIKNFSEYRGIKTTKINRCIITALQDN